MADQPPVRLRAIQRLARDTSKRRPANRQHTPVNLVSYVNLIPVVGRSPPARPATSLDVAGGLGFAVFDGGLQRGVVEFVLVGVGFGEVGDGLVELV